LFADNGKHFFNYPSLIRTNRVVILTQVNAIHWQRLLSSDMIMVASIFSPKFT